MSENTSKTPVRYDSRMLKKWLDLLEDFPFLSQLGAPRLCAAVYYPIALLKMRLSEHSFEDFDAVELSILRFCGAGVCTAEAICRWMGISSCRYVEDRLSLLCAEGLLQPGTYRPTPLGLESLEQGQKKQICTTEQIFQADGVMGILLPREFQKRTDKLLPRGETRSYPHLMHSDQIAEDTIRAAIQGEDKVRAYKDYRKDILHVNVEQVQAIRFVELRYMLVLMVRFEGTAPLVFLPRYQREKRDAGRAFGDAPLYLPRSLVSRLPELAGQARAIPDSELAGLTDLCDMVEEATALVTPEDVCNWMEANTAFQVRGCPLEGGHRLCPRLTWRGPGAPIHPLDMELMAAAGGRGPRPVELSVRVPGGQRSARFVRLTVWPTADRLPPEATILAEGWSANCATWLKGRRAYSYSEFQALIARGKEPENHGEE